MWFAFYISLGKHKAYRINTPLCLIRRLMACSVSFHTVQITGKYMFYKISCVTLKCLFCVVTSKGKYEGMFLLVQIFTFCVKRVYTFCYNLIRFSFQWHFLTFTKTSDKRVYQELLLFEKQTTKDKLKSQKRQINYSQYQWQYFNRWKKIAHTATLW